MDRVMEWAGFVGAGLAGGAYVPQIWHLVAERCSAGISRLAFATWLAASLLVTAHAVAIGSPAFVVLGGIQIVATALIVVFSTRYRDARCPTHRTFAELDAVELDGAVVRHEHDAHAAEPPAESPELEHSAPHAPAAAGHAPAVHDHAGR